MKYSKTSVIYFILVLFLVVIFFINFIAKYVVQELKDDGQQCFSVSQDCSDFINNSSAEELNSLKLKYSQLETKYDNWINLTHRIYDEKQFWREQSYRIGNNMMLCWNENTDVPNKTLEKEQVCRKGCYYNLLCTNSMKPFFDCTDTLTVYTNIEKNEIRLCDVIGFKTPEYPDYDWVVHRVINITNEGYMTKGDALAYPDNYTVKFEDVIFKVIGVDYH